MPSSTRHRGSFSSAISYSALPPDPDQAGNPAKKLLAVSLMLLGLAVIGLGLAWKTIYPEKTYWSPEQAKEFASASLAVKIAADVDGRRQNAPDPPELVAARERWEKIQADLAAARNSRNRSPILFMAVGGVLAGIGVFSLLSMRDDK